jgi:hypothetical protein
MYQDLKTIEIDFLRKLGYINISVGLNQQIFYFDFLGALEFFISIKITLHDCFTIMSSLSSHQRPNITINTSEHKDSINQLIPRTRKKCKSFDYKLSEPSKSLRMCVPSKLYSDSIISEFHSQTSTLGIPITELRSPISEGKSPDDKEICSILGFNELNIQEEISIFNKCIYGVIIGVDKYTAFLKKLGVKNPEIKTPPIINSPSSDRTNSISSAEQDRSADSSPFGFFINAGEEKYTLEYEQECCNADSTIKHELPKLVSENLRKLISPEYY